MEYSQAFGLLMRLDGIHTDIKDGSKHKGCRRDEIVWALDVNRNERFMKAKPPGYKAGDVPTATMLDAISHLRQKGEETGIRTSPSELLEALEKLGFDCSKTEKYLNATGTLMKRQSELGIVNLEEVEEAMEAHENDDAKVIQLFEHPLVPGLLLSPSLTNERNFPCYLSPSLTLSALR